jgi:hypothetical protein
MSPTTKIRTITLTDRRPIRIADEEWPEIVAVTGTSADEDPNLARAVQTLNDRMADRYALRVRQHADGRAVVYLVVSAAVGPDYRAGKLLEAGADLVAAIHRVADGHVPAALVRQANADLPAEVL